MKSILNALFVGFALLATACTPSNEAIVARLEQGDASALPDFRTAAARLPWLAHYQAAAILNAEQPGEEAIKWFYTGQLRARVAARYDSHPDGTSALVGSLNETIGRPINEYAGGDQTRWLAAIDAATAWSKANPYTLDLLKQDLPGQSVTVTQAELQESFEQALQGMAKLRDQVAALTPAYLKQQRQENGLQ